MYPLSMTNPVVGGYAVANDEGEHRALTNAGYLPAFVAAAETTPPEPVKRGPGRPRKVE